MATMDTTKYPCTCGEMPDCRWCKNGHSYMCYWHYAKHDETLFGNPGPRQEAEVDDRWYDLIDALWEQEFKQ
jgi:hypothetical protein